MPAEQDALADPGGQQMQRAAMLWVLFSNHIPAQGLSEGTDFPESALDSLSITLATPKCMYALKPEWMLLEDRVLLCLACGFFRNTWHQALPT